MPAVARLPPCPREHRSTRSESTAGCSSRWMMASTIALTVYQPDSDNDGPYPTIVESLPYRKDDAFYSSDWPTYAYLAGRGFAGVRIDIRGTGASTGIIEDEYVPREQEDTLAVFRWLADQEWCSGNLGMWGVSWGGFSSLQTAMLRPPRAEGDRAGSRHP